MTYVRPLLAAAAGALTVLSPCVLPVLPIVVGATLGADRRAPLALCAGLTTSFALAGTLLALTATWVAPLASTLRLLAILLLLAFGVMTIFPNLGTRAFGMLGLARLARPTRRTGPLGAFVLGTQLGLVWSPCAGPILGSILTLAAVRRDVGDAFVQLACYGIEASVPMALLAYGGRRAARAAVAFRSRAASLHRLGGVAIAASALAILLGWDVRIEDALVPYLPTLPRL